MIEASPERHATYDTIPTKDVLEKEKLETAKRSVVAKGGGCKVDYNGRRVSLNICQNSEHKE